LAGKWVRVYVNGQWTDAYIDDWPTPIRGGAVSTLPAETKTILGRDGKPVKNVTPKRPIGFRPEDAR
jgi:hypothetical protein